MMKYASDIRVGDVIVHGRQPHLVTEIEPYTHPTLGETYGIARDAHGWGVTLIGPVRFEVATLEQPALRAVA